MENHTTPGSLGRRLNLKEVWHHLWETVLPCGPPSLEGQAQGAKMGKQGRLTTSVGKRTA